jgi:hypothetical protein
MAIPTSAFASSASIALMRQNASTAEWFFVAWVRPNDSDFFFDEPGPGNFVYALWVVLGADSPVPSVDFSASKQQAIYVMESRR